MPEFVLKTENLGISFGGGLADRLLQLSVEHCNHSESYNQSNNAHRKQRAAAQHFGISKSTVHKDLQQRLPRYNRVLYEQVRQVLDVNKSQRHIRGGDATRRKYKGI